MRTKVLKGKSPDEKLTEGSIAKSLILFSLPILLSNVLQQMYNLADSIIVGNIVGENALSAVTINGKITMVLTSFFMGIGAGAGVVVSHFYGAKDKENLSKSVNTTMLLSVIFGLLLTVVGLIFSEPLLRLIDTPESIMEHSVSYLRIYFLGTLFVFVYNLGSGVLRAVGDSVTPLIFLGVAALLNIGLDLWFVRLWGVAGAGWATLISQAVASVLTVLRLVLSKKDYRLDLKHFKVSFPIFKRIVKIGLPVGLQNCIVSVAHLVMQRYINSFDDPTIAGASAYSKIDGFIYMPINSFALAITSFVGQNIGAGKYDRVKKSMWICLLITEIVSVVTSIVVFFACEPLLKFAGASDAAVPTGLLFMKVMIFSYPILIISDTLAGVMRGAGAAFVPSVVMISCWCVFRVLFIIVVFNFWHNIVVVFLSYTSSWIISSIILIVYYFRGKWFKKAVDSVRSESDNNAERQITAE